MKQKEKLANFMKELNELLVKYEASISFSYYGDTHGIDDEMTTICFKPESPRNKWDYEEEVAHSHDTFLDSSNTSKERFDLDWF